MEPKYLFVCSILVLLSLGVCADPYPEHYHQELGHHHGGGHNEIVDYYVSWNRKRGIFDNFNLCVI